MHRESAPTLPKAFQASGPNYLLLIIASLLFAALLNAAQAPSVLRTITTAGEAHGLSTEEASRAYPVHLRGVVTCIDPSSVPLHAAVFLHDATGGIYAIVPDAQKADFPAGTIVDGTGVTGPGTAAPIVDLTAVRAIGHAQLPADAPLENLFHLETGAEDGKWVEVEGTVHSLVVYDNRHFNFKYVSMQLAMVGGTIGVSMLWEPGVSYDGLIDAKVRIRGNAAPVFNRNDQVIGARLMAPGMETVKVVEAAAGDPFREPITPINNLLRWNMITTSHHRVHVRGRVTLRWPGTSLCVRDEGRGVCAQTTQDTGLHLGDRADVVGFANAENGTTVLTDATFKTSGQNRPLVPKPLTMEHALAGKDDAELVQVEGQLIGSDLTSADVTLLLASGDTIYTAILPKSLATAESSAWKIGSKLRLTGILSVRLDVEGGAKVRGIAQSKSFRVLMRSPGDVAVLRQPSWWTSGRAFAILSILLVVVVGAFGWIALLRRRVRSQLADLQKAREEAAAISELARAMQAVTGQRKLSARVSASGSEQIAQLGVELNKMLSELEDGDLAMRRAEARLQHQALTDELTDLPNRRALSDVLEHDLAVAKRDEQVLGVLFIDLDGFKTVNDSLGHRVGDLLLVEVAKRLKTRIRASDTLARIGGDEFTVALTLLHERGDAAIVANGLIDALSKPFVMEGIEVTIGASIGISTFPEDGQDAVTLLKQADSAMYEAKTSGKNQTRFFTPELGLSVDERVSLESHLRGAIARGEIHLHYQPAFDLRSRRLTRFEALARWTSSALGVVPPGKFIHVAEQSGQIVALGAYVLRQACQEAVAWQALTSDPVQVAVNVSSIQFERETFVDEVAQTLFETGLRPDLLQIELTESIMLKGAERVADCMRRLHALGVTLAIDDFGTGYSCLSYLPILPFDTMKIDRSFVKDLGVRIGATSIVSFLITLAHSLNMHVVVEGVETAEQLNFVEAMDGNEVQGFLLGRPTSNPRKLLTDGKMAPPTQDLFAVTL